MKNQSAVTMPTPLAPSPPEQLHYDHIEEFFLSSIRNGSDFLFDQRLFRDELRRLWDTYHVPYSTLQSFVRNLHVAHVKKKAPVVKGKIDVIVHDLLLGKASILELSKKWNFPPYLLIRSILETVILFSGKNNGENNKKKAITDLIRNPHLLNEESYISMYQNMHPNIGTLLYDQTKEATDADPMYGLQSDRERHIVGIEYEVVLEHQLKLMGIPFESENQLRDRGTSKTPDVLLSVPIGIEITNGKNSMETREWKMVCWIDSKALFGDVTTHHSSVLPQAESYLHRFGPGLVIYWLGHAPIDRLGSANGDVIIIGWDLPQKVMLPTGKIMSSVESDKDAH